MGNRIFKSKSEKSENNIESSSNVFVIPVSELKGYQIEYENLLLENKTKALEIIRYENYCNKLKEKIKKLEYENLDIRVTLNVLKEKYSNLLNKN